MPLRFLESSAAKRPHVTAPPSAVLEISCNLRQTLWLLSFC